MVAGGRALVHPLLVGYLQLSDCLQVLTYFVLHGHLVLFKVLYLLPEREKIIIKKSMYSVSK